MRLIVLLAFALLVNGCQKKHPCTEDGRQIIRLNVSTEPPTLDTRKATDTSSIGVISMCFEGLMKRGKKGAIQPAIAHKVELSDDNTTYTFHLRDAKWWDGKPVTAHDFEHTWKTILEPEFLSGFANELYVLKNGWAVKNGEAPIDALGVRAIDAHTLEVKVEFPIPYFLDLVASHSFLAVPKHITVEHPKWADNSGAHFVGNGPYKLKKWKHHNCIILEKNESYWDHEAILLDQIDLSIIEDTNTALNMFEAGELDWAGYPLSSLPTDALQALSDNKRLSTYPLCGTYYYIFNVLAPPFDNLNMRKAFSLSIHRKAIIENITQSDQIPATSFIPPTIWDVHSHFNDYDVEEAQRLFQLALDEMGYTRETLPKITLTYNTSESHHKIAQAIQEQWFRAFGIRVRLANVEWKVFLDELSHKQFQVARMGGIGGYNDPMTFFDLYKYPNLNTNFSGWNNPLFTQLIEEAERTLDPKKREQLLRDAEKIFIDEMPIAPIYYYQGTYIKKNSLKGVHLSEFTSADFKFAFLETQ
ncbi:MAG: Oligopeptide-binding protein OppA [Chlamydiae bacterium]|nr:Oligopeptide-binding protein OppA [Chlamydiota bacterium]